MADKAGSSQRSNAEKNHENVNETKTATDASTCTQLSFPPFCRMLRHRMRSNRTRVVLEQDAGVDLASRSDGRRGRIDEPNVRPASKLRRRCAHCNRRLNITNTFDCRCGGTFCPQHRHAEAHNCTYDYKTEGRKMIAKQNPRIVAPKITKL